MKKITAMILCFCLGALTFGGMQAVAAAISATPSTAKVLVNNREVPVSAYNIDGNNYFKLRDLTAALDVGVWYDSGGDIIHIETDKKYDPNYVGPELNPNPSSPSDSAERFSETIFWDDLVIIFGSYFNWTTLHSPGHAADGATVISVPITIRNVRSDPRDLKLLHYVQYDPSGKSLAMVDPYFDNSISNTLILRSNNHINLRMYFLYEGDGTYLVDFSNDTGSLAVEIPIKR